MKKKLFAGTLIGLAAGLIGLGLWYGGVLDRLEWVTWSLRVRAFARPSVETPKIKVILLDQASLDWGKQASHWPWPWPREAYSAVLQFLKRGGARAVAFDVLYTEPSFFGVSDDETLGAAIAQTPAFVAAVFAGSSGDAEAWPESQRRNAIHIEGLKEWLAAHPQAEVSAPRAAFPVPEIATNATLLGNVSHQPDADGVTRRIQLFNVFNGEVTPALGLAAYLAARRAEGQEAKLAIRGRWLEIDGRRLPIDDRGAVVLRFRGRGGAHQRFGAAGVIQSELRMLEGAAGPIPDPAVFKDCFVFLGFSAPGLLDLRPTPLSRVYPGVEIHTTLLDNVLSGDPLRDAGAGPVAGLTLLCGLAAGLLVAFAKRPAHSVLAFVVCLPLPVLIGFGAYQAGTWWPVTAGVCAVALGLVGTVVYNYATEGRQKAFIKQAFRHYLSPDVIEQILDDPAQLKLGGERRELSIFFSDLQGFSSFSERLDPEALTALLNAYLGDMTDILLEEGGTLDKYEGDAIIAFWGAPLPQSDHAVRACRAALRCQRKLTARREEFRQQTGAVLRMRVGLNTGEVVVGNLGSSQRFDYTILGDAANLASRLEGANKVFGTYLMVAESTWKQTGGAFVGREMGRVRVVGRATPVRVFEVLALAGEAPPLDLASYERGMALCAEKKWAEAQECFRKLADDPLSQKYAEQCGRLAADPAAAWDGVWELTSK